MFRALRQRTFHGPSLSNSSPSRGSLRYEPLEPRLMLYAVTGQSWNNTDVSFSFLPDGTTSEGYQSSLYAELDPVADTAIWQREFARALQTWSNVSTLNFHSVDDAGLATGISGLAQGDSRFGDIRLGAHPLDGYVGYAYYPSSTTKGGDITINPNYTFHVGTYIDLYSVLLHESGHSLGLDHSTSGTVMYPTITGVYSGLTPDDIGGIQSIYGARQDDPFDSGGRNDSLASASALNLDSAGDGLFVADLTTMDDLDYYSLVAPSDTHGSLTVSVDADGLSLLAAQVALYESDGTLVGAVDVGDAYGTAATLQFGSVVSGDTYYILADGATDDEFGMGAYRLDINFDLSEDPDPPILDPDRFELNDTLLTAAELGRMNHCSEMGLTLHTASDVDVYHFSARKGGDFRITANFASTFDYEIAIYDANRNLVSQTAGSSAQVDLFRGEEAFVQVRSPAGEVDVYDLFFERVGRGAIGGEGEGGSKVDKGNGRWGLPHVPDEGRESFARPQTVAEGIGPFAASRFLSNRGEQPGFNRSTGEAERRWQAIGVTVLREADWHKAIDAQFAQPGVAHRPGVTRRMVNRMANRPVGSGLLADWFDTEALLEDLAGEWGHTN